MSKGITKGKRKKKRARRFLSPEKDTQETAVSLSDFSRLEFFRHGFALVPDPADRSPGTAILIRGDQREPDSRYCSCAVSRKQTCEHILKLTALYKGFKNPYGDQTPEEAFRSSFWSRLATVLSEGSLEACGSAPYEFPFFLRKGG